MSTFVRSEELLADFRPTWRRNVRIAERKNVVIREATSEADLDTYYELLKITSERETASFIVRISTKRLCASLLVQEIWSSISGT